MFTEIKLANFSCRNILSRQVLPLQKTIGIKTLRQIRNMFFSMSAKVSDLVRGKYITVQLVVVELSARETWPGICF